MTPLELKKMLCYFPYPACVIQEGLFRVANPKMCEFTGYPEKELVGLPLAEIIVQADLPGVMEALHNCKHGENLSGEIQCSCVSHRVKDIYVRLLFSGIEYNGLPAALCQWIDITSQKQVEKKIRRNEKRFRLLYENAPLGYQSLDEDGIIVEVNKAWLELLGYSKNEVIGQWFGNFLDQQSLDRFKENFCLFKATGIVRGVEFQIRHKDGASLSIIANGRIGYDEKGNFKQTHCIIEDITQKKFIENELKESEAKYRSLFANMLNGFAYHRVIVDENNKPVDYVFLEVNDAFERLTGIKKDWVVGKRVTEVIPGIEKSEFDWIGNYGRVALTGEAVKFDQYFELLGRWYSISAYSTEKGYFAVVFTEITKRILAEDALRSTNEELEVTIEELNATEEELRQQYEELQDREEALRDSEERFRQLFHNANDAIFLTQMPDASGVGRFIEVNQVACRTLGYSRDEFLERTSGDIISADCLARIPGITREFGKKGRSTFEMFLVSKEGVKIPVEINAHVFTLNGQTVMLSIARDITDRKRAEIVLRESEAMYRSLVETSPDAIILTNLNADIMMANQQASLIYGLERPEGFIGRNVFEFFVPEDKDRAWVGFQRLIEKGNVRDARYSLLKKDGTTFPIELSASVIVDADGKPTALIGVVRDITDRKLAEEALQQSERRFRLITENMLDTICLADRNFIIQYASPAFERILGIPCRDLIGKSFFQGIHPDDLPGVRENFRKAVETRANGSAVYRYRRVNGQYLWFETNGNILYDENGSIEGIVFANRDITERKQVEDQLHHAQKMEAVGQLAGGIAHDFNNLLTGILGNISLAQADAPRGSAQATVLEEAEGAAKRAAEITAQLLGFSRKAMLQPLPVDINRCISETSSLLRRTIGPRIIVDTRLDPDIWVVQADPAQITQVIMNLCLNAQDAMPGGGAILMETGNVKLGDDYAMAHPGHGRAGEFVMLSVSDTGCGMPPEVRDRIFEPFFTTKGSGRGTGLGLAMVYGIVRQQEGWIECYSEEGRGTRFTIYLPRLAGSGPTPLSAPASDLCLNGSETVLVVDDEEMVRNLAQRILSRYGYRVMSAKDGRSAVEIYRREKGIGLVLLDMTMPGLSGRETLGELKKQDPGAKVLLSSGYSLNGLGEDLLTNGAAGFVQKPYRASELARAVRQALDMKKGT